MGKDKALGDPTSGAQATFNSSKDVSITLTGANSELDFFQPPAGTARVFNLTGRSGGFNSGVTTFYLLNPAVIPTGDTLNLLCGNLDMTNHNDAVADGAKVNIFSGARLNETGPETGTFEIKPGGILFLSGTTLANGATFIFDPGSIIQLNSSIDTGNWIPPQSDILVDIGGTIGGGLQLGPGQRLSASADTGELWNTPISPRPDAPADASFKFTSASGGLQFNGLYINGPVSFGPDQTLQIGDTVPWQFDNLLPTGFVHFDNNIVTVGHLNVVSGTLLLGSPGSTLPQINASTISISHNATLAGAGTINANQLTIAGTLAPGFRPGTLQINANTTLLPGSSYQWQIDSTSPLLARWDLLLIDSGS